MDRFRKEAVPMVAGSISGCLTKTATAPMERAKILLQVQDANKYRGLWGTLRTVALDEGLKGLFKGNLTNVIRIVPNYALKFGFNDRFRDAIRAPGQSVSEMSFSQLMLAGTMAGVWQLTITYPLETVRVRLTLSPDLLGGFRYRGIGHCFSHTVRHEGFGALFKGYSVALIVGAPYVGLQMTLYQWLQNRATDFLGETTLPWYWKVGIAGVSGVVSQTTMYPGDTVRRCLQANGAGASHRIIYTSTWHCIQSIAQNQGLIGFYRGALVNVFKAMPAAIIQFATYDYFKEALMTRH